MNLTDASFQHSINEDYSFNPATGVDLTFKTVNMHGMSGVACVSSRSHSFLAKIPLYLAFIETSFAPDKGQHIVCQSEPRCGLIREAGRRV